MKHNRFSWIQPILLVGIFVVSAVADVTAHGSFDAGKTVAFNAAVQAIDAKWHLRNANAPRGDLWFITADKLQDAPFDAGVLIQEKDGRSELELVLRPLKKEPKQSDADQLLAQLLQSMAGKRAAPSVNGLINREGKSEAVIESLTLDGAFAAAVKVARGQGHLVRFDAATHEVVFISGTSTESISLGITLSNQFGDVRFSAKHWTPSGGRISDEVYADQAFSNFIEALGSELKNGRTPVVN